jgi:hypothetical protein
MMEETLRIDALRRRVRPDPAPAAFASLAEPCRRRGLILHAAIPTARRVAAGPTI